MKKTVLRSFGLSLAVMALVMVAPASSRADLIQNGSFEIGSAPGGHLPLDAGSHAITGWTVVSAGSKGEDAIDYIGTTWDASHGSRSLDLNGYYNTGGIEQGFNTTVGKTYRVTFDMAGNPDPRPIVKTMQVSAIGTTTQSEDFSFDITGKSRTAMGWETMDWTFTADASYTTLRFMSTVTGAGVDAWGPALDNVRVTPVPGAAILAVAGLGLARWKLRRRGTA